MTQERAASRFLAFVIGNSLLLLIIACVEPVAAPSPTSVLTVHPTVTAIMSSIPTPSATPTPHTPTPTPQTPTPTIGPMGKDNGYLAAVWYVLGNYVLVDEQLIAGYRVQLWDDPQYIMAGASCVTISGGSSAQTIFIFTATGIAPLSGTDITGEGNPDIIIVTWAGGAYCCASTLVYDAGPRLSLVMESPAVADDKSGDFQDLDEDGSYEFITWDDTFAFSDYCRHGPGARVVLDYEPGLGYVPASPRFAYLYEAEMAQTKILKAEDLFYRERSGAPPDPQHSVTKCHVVAALLPYFYSGHINEGWQEFDRLYVGEDKEAFHQEIQHQLDSSCVFVTPEEVSR